VQSHPHASATEFVACAFDERTVVRQPMHDLGPDPPNIGFVILAQDIQGADNSWSRAVHQRDLESPMLKGQSFARVRRCITDAISIYLDSDDLDSWTVGTAQPV